jgi:tetratricopeptide (TPR) repeat protein
LHPSYLITMELDRARELADRSLKMSEEEADSLMLASSYAEIGNILTYQGRFVDAQAHMKKALVAPDARSRWPGFFRSFPQPLALSLLGWNSWFLGYPDQARQHVERSLALAKNQPSEFLASASTMWNLRVYICLRDAAILDRARTFAAFTNERGYSGLSPLANLFHGWALAVQGDTAQGIPIMEATLRDLLRMSRMPTYLHALFAEAYCAVGRSADGLRHVEESLRLSNETGERTARAEIYHLKGELLMLQNAANIAEAEREFRTAIDIAHEQNAKSWELRATTSLARLLAKQGKRDEAGTMLAEIYGWFTEGFDTADLKDAKALLDELGG